MKPLYPRAAALLLVASVAATVYGDDSPVIASGKQTVDVVKQIYHVCPTALSCITSYAGANGGPRWTTVAAFHGRYVLTVQFDVELDDEGEKITSSSPPTFELTEIQSVNLDADGQVTGYQQVKLLTFGPKQWQKVVDHAGDWSVLDLKLVKNQPVANLDKYLQSVTGADQPKAPPSTGP